MVRKTTKELLTDSFIELAQHKPVNKITVADITSNCGVTPPTFYRYFRDKYDLIAWIYVREAQKFLGQVGVNGYTWRNTLRDGMRYFAENRQFALNALKHTSGRDSFIEQKTRLDLGFIIGIIRKRLMTETIPDELLVTVKLYLYGTEHYLCEWLVDDMPLPWEKVAALMEACVPEALRPYLFEDMAL
ncbi:MAG: TetR family transcriptional regulator [Clostridia bacterium]|nr:TetR family transcriptional regulator [Clostridia bacterium]